MPPKRVVRFKEETAGNGVPRRKARKETRTVSEIMEELSTLDASTVAEDLNEAEQQALIDYGTETDEQRKALDSEVKRVKSLVLATAESEGWKTKTGLEGAAKISPRTKTSIVPRKMVKLLAKLKKQKLFDTLFSVKIGEVKKYLGEDVLKPISIVETKAYGSVSFKRLKKKKK